MMNYWIHCFHGPTRTRVWASTVGRLYQETIYLFTQQHKEQRAGINTLVCSSVSSSLLLQVLWLWGLGLAQQSLRIFLTFPACCRKWLSTLHSEIAGLHVHAIYQGLAYSVPRSLWWNSPRNPSLHSWQQCLGKWYHTCLFGLLALFASSSLRHSQLALKTSPTLIKHDPPSQCSSLFFCHV